jgi:dTDP-4-amino-4,6-dideoxygalactose transaminase
MIPIIDLKKQYMNIKHEIDTAILSVINSGKFILGENVSKFEEKIQEYFNVKYAIGVNSGTDAIYLSLLANDIQPGDEVITSVFTFIATVEAICLLGATPVLIDIDERTYNIHVKKMKEKISKKTKAIIPVHLFGYPCDMDEIIDIAKKRKIKVIEDCAQSFSAEYKGKKVGTFGNAGCFSFYPTKILGCYGDGGMVITNDENISKKVKMLRDHGSEKKYFHKMIGINSRLDEIQASILLVKLKYVDSWIKRRIEIAKKYNELFKNTDIITPYEEKDNKHVYNYYTIRVKKRELIVEGLKREKIFPEVHYPMPIHLQPSLNYLEYKKGNFPVAEKVANEVISIPIYPELTDEEIEKVAKTIIHLTSQEVSS